MYNKTQNCENEYYNQLFVALNKRKLQAPNTVSVHSYRTALATEYEMKSVPYNKKRNPHKYIAVQKKPVIAG